MKPKKNNKNNNNNKGKIHPSPSSSSHSTQSNYLSILSLLPSTILTLITLLSIQEKQTLAYMLTRSLNFYQNTTNKRTKTHPHHNNNPLFDCDCFNCYTSYWEQWDTSPNREIIHQAIEAFEDSEVKQKKRVHNKRRAKVKKPIIENVQNVDDAAPVNEAVVGGGDDDKAVIVKKVLPDVVGMIGSRLWSFWSLGIIDNNSPSVP